MQPEPRVSVVTPFYNTEPYIAECIESVLAQTHANFEYLLVNNKSSDGSRETAARYAARDPRIRLIDNPEFVSLIDNFNGALRQIAPDSAYVKMVLADDLLYPECLAKMVEVGERAKSAWLVAAYFQQGDDLAGAGVPRGVSCMPGREACRRMLLDGYFMLGTPTTVMYRAEAVRATEQFFPVGRYHPDSDVGFALLLEHDLGFVHQVLSFVRTDNVSITNSTQQFHPNLLDYLMLLERFGPSVLTREELARRGADTRKEYYAFLGRAVLRAKGRRFWDYHRGGLATIGRDLRWQDLLPASLNELLRLSLNPGQTLEQALGEIRKRVRGEQDHVPLPHQRAERQQQP